MFIERRFHSPDLRRKGLFVRTRLQVPAVVELENLEKSYRLGKVTVNALRGVTLKLWQAEFMVIMGPSGSGKTTLLNIIGTLDKPSSGRALVDGEDITRMNDAQLTRLRRHKTGFEVVQLMHTMAKQEGSSVVVVTHDPVVAERADRLVEMRDGRITEKVREPLMGQRRTIRAVEPLPPEPGRSLSQPN